MIDPEKNGQKMRMCRGDKTVQEVADATNISRSALTMYECGKRTPRDAVKIRLARYYGESIESLFFS